MSYKQPAASNTTQGVMSTDTYDFVTTNGAVQQRDGSAVYFVGKWGNDAADGLTFSSAKLTIQAAVTAAPADSVILVHPGTYTEAITHGASNVSVFGVGHKSEVIITQADAAFVVSVNTRTNIVYQDVTVQMTAATEHDRATVLVSTGNVVFRQCSVRMVCSAAIADAEQPAVIRITSTGSAECWRGTMDYLHSGNGGATAIKSAILLLTNGSFCRLIDMRQITVTNSGTALVTTLAYDLATTGYFDFQGNIISMSDAAATSLYGVYLTGTSALHYFSRNNITIVGGGGKTAGKIYCANAALTVKSFYERASVTGGANNYSYNIGAAATVISEYDVITAATGKTGAGTLTCVYSPANGTSSISDSLILQPSTAHAPLLGQGTSAVTSMAVGGTGQTIVGVSGADPVWGGIPGGAGAPVVNLGLTYAAGTLTLTSAAVAALSSTNVGYVTMQGKTAGVVKTIAITADQSTTDGAAGAMDNTRFGLVTGVSWGNDLPLFLYLVINDAENAVCAMLSRNPAAKVAPAAASIGKTGAIVNVGQGDFFAFGNPTVTDYDGNPCICIGSVRAQFDGATDSFTIQALSASDGIGQYQDGVGFILPAGVNGSEASRYFQATAGTEPAFTTSSAIYRIFRNGMVFVMYNFQTCSNIPAGAQNSALTLPYANKDTYGIQGAFKGSYTINATTTSHALFGFTNSTNSYIPSLNWDDRTVVLTNASYGTSDSMGGDVWYQAF